MQAMAECHCNKQEIGDVRLRGADLKHHGKNKSVGQQQEQWLQQGPTHPDDRTGIPVLNLTANKLQQEPGLHPASNHQEGQGNKNKKGRG